MSETDAAPLALTHEHVRKRLEVVAVQRALIDHIRLAGRPTELEENLLRTFEDTLVIFEEDLERLRIEAAKLTIDQHLAVRLASPRVLCSLEGQLAPIHDAA